MTTAQLRRLFGLPPTASGSEVVAEAVRLKAAQREFSDQFASSAVRVGIDTGRLLRVHRPWATAFAQRDPEAFVAFLEGAPKWPTRSAVDEYLFLTQRAIARSDGKLAFRDAMTQVASEHRELVDEVRAEQRSPRSSGRGEAGNLRAGGGFRTSHTAQ